MNKISFSFKAPDQPKPHAYIGASGALYVKSKNGEWFAFLENGTIEEASPLTGKGEGYTPIEGPVTITINP